MYSCLWTGEPYGPSGGDLATRAASIAARIWPASGPPPTASNARVAPVWLIAVVSCSRKSGFVEFAI
jgi:hypothetical protein